MTKKVLKAWSEGHFKIIDFETIQFFLQAINDLTLKDCRLY